MNNNCVFISAADTLAISIPLSFSQYCNVAFLTQDSEDHADDDYVHLTTCGFFNLQSRF